VHLTCFCWRSYEISLDLMPLNSKKRECEADVEVVYKYPEVGPVWTHDRWIREVRRVRWKPKFGAPCSSSLVLAVEDLEVAKGTATETPSTRPKTTRCIPTIPFHSQRTSNPSCIIASKPLTHINSFTSFIQIRSCTFPLRRSHNPSRLCSH